MLSKRKGKEGISIHKCVLWAVGYFKAILYCLMMNGLNGYQGKTYCLGNYLVLFRILVGIQN